MCGTQSDCSFIYLSTNVILNENKNDLKSLFWIRVVFIIKDDSSLDSYDLWPFYSIAVFHDHRCNTIKPNFKQCFPTKTVSRD